MTLQCETAQTPSTVVWLKGHTELKAGGRYEMSQKEGVLTLTIKQLEEKDTDIYTCDVGTAKIMAKVTVNGKYLCLSVHTFQVSCCLAELVMCMNDVLFALRIVLTVFFGQRDKCNVDVTHSMALL